MSAPAAGVEFSSATISDLHQLVGVVGSTSALVNLPVFPERLTFEVRWGIIEVGNATLEAAKLVNFAGKTAVNVVSEATSNGFCDTFYKVRDLNESWINAATASSLGYSKKLREGHFFRDEWVLFNSDKGQFLSKTTGRGGNFAYKSGTIPASVQDILSSLYYIRTKTLTLGSEITLDVNTKDNWPLVVRVIKKERIRTPAGTFNTVLIEPALRQEGIFIQKGKRLQIWLSDDARKMPVLMKVQVFFGHITASLLKVQP